MTSILKVDQLQDSGGNAIITSDGAGNITTPGITTYTNSDALTLFNASGSAPVYACRSWVNFNGTGTPAIRASGNVSSITDVATGTYRVNFTTAMTDANYGNVASVDYDTNGSTINVDRGNQTTTYMYLEVRNAAQTVDVDRAYIHAAVFR